MKCELKIKISNASTRVRYMQGSEPQNSARQNDGKYMENMCERNEVQWIEMYNQRHVRAMRQLRRIHVLSDEFKTMLHQSYRGDYDYAVTLRSCY